VEAPFSDSLGAAGSSSSFFAGEDPTLLSLSVGSTASTLLWFIAATLVVICEAESKTVLLGDVSTSIEWVCAGDMRYHGVNPVTSICCSMKEVKVRNKASKGSNFMGHHLCSSESDLPKIPSAKLFATLAESMEFRVTPVLCVDSTRRSSEKGFPKGATIQTAAPN
jgi:hypothetical protein